MPREYKLPMTLIEGHAEVLLLLDDKDRVLDVRYSGTDVRFFERFWVGLPGDELPRVVPMICGVCSTSHHVCSAKALDHVYGVEAPEPAKRLRRMLNLALHFNNQLLHLVAMGLPSLANSEVKGLQPLAKARPSLVLRGLRLARLGLDAIKVLGGRPIHPVVAVGGGVVRLPPRDELEKLAEAMKARLGELREVLEEAYTLVVARKELIDEVKLATRLAIATRDDRGAYELTYGETVVFEPGGGELARIGHDYQKALEEKPVEYSYVRHVYHKGKPLFTGALARFLLCKSYGSPEADELRDRVREELGDKPLSPVAYHYARLVEALAAYHQLLEELQKPLEGEHYTRPARASGEGVGVVEAPRGTLVHHYRVGEDGATEYVNIITPTAINAASIEETLRSLAVGEKPSKELADRINLVVTCYDPCMSCATHMVRVRAVRARGGRR